MERKFTKEHEWISCEKGVCTVGISNYAQKELGDVVYVSLTKDIGDKVNKGDDVAEIESVKSVSQIYAPVAGEVAEFNSIFEDESQSGAVNEDPYGKGWIFKLKISDEKELNDLLSEKDYEDYIKTL
ncbi:MAG: glycine cleavage system protein H [Spirochaetes bacterium GWD1_27_9]|nr:MAG: glycine cleavage system protein H [Spirochaetes bacterium GWB1_27_13]OHD21876.1 MAG: glycine cleavage system protein H [Spirochaetes bacterium GWC1_27_15]OHD37833.1 MAG: glycine cleavage system protein H [Spirochaetes bacterium GWD1_27_9]